MKNYVEKLRKYKEDKKITTRALSDITGINYHTLSSWFQNKGLPRGKTKTLVLKFFEKEESQTLNGVSEPCKSEEVQENTVITKAKYNNKYEIVKLESVEEIIDALNNEEVLISDNFLIKIEKGIIVKYDLTMKPLFVNPALDFNCSYSVRRKKPIVLAVLKRFKDEEGNIWYVYKEDSNFPLYEALNENSGVLRDFNKNGKSLNGEINLIEEI